MIYNDTLNDYGKVCNSSTIYIVLFLIAFFLIVIGISSAYFLLSVTLGNNNTNINTIINTNVNTGVVIYYIYINGKYQTN